MRCIDLEKDLDQVIVYLVEAASELDEVPAAFLLHSIRVGLSLQQEGYSREIVLAGLLHDVVEDTRRTVDDVRSRFGSEVARLVEANTVNKVMDRLERSREVMYRAKRVGRDALVVKAADLEDNLRFYLADANRSMLGWLEGLLPLFLDLSSEDIGSERVWAELQEQRRKISVHLHGEEAAS